MDARTRPVATQRLAEALAELAWRPLTPKFVLTALGISNAERLCWTKSGRLANAGAILIRRGQLVAVPTYRVDQIEQLLAHPDVLRGWREQDAADRKLGNTDAA